MSTNENTSVSVAVREPDLVPSGSLSSSLDQVRDYIRASKAENTLRGYQSDWLAFCAWCDVRQLRAVPASPETVAGFIADCASSLKAGTIQRRLNAIAEAHKAVGLESPTIIRWLQTR